MSLYFGIFSYIFWYIFVHICSYILVHIRTYLFILFCTYIFVHIVLYVHIVHVCTLFWYILVHIGTYMFVHNVFVHCPYCPGSPHQGGGGALRRLRRRLVPISPSPKYRQAQNITICFTYTPMNIAQYTM